MKKLRFNAFLYNEAKKMTFLMFMQVLLVATLFCYPSSFVQGQIRTLPIDAHNSGFYFSRDGKMVLAENGSLPSPKIFDLESGKEICLLSGINSWVFEAAFSSNGKLVLVSTNNSIMSVSNKIFKLFDVQTGKEIRTIHSDFANNGTNYFSPDLKTALSSTSDEMLKLWDVQTGKEIRTFLGHTGRCRTVCFSPDGKTALSGSDKVLKLWDVQTGKEIRTFLGHTDFIRTVCFSPDGKTALSGGFDDLVKVWDIQTGKEIRTFYEHTGNVFIINISPDGKKALSLDDDGKRLIWDIQTGKLIHTLPKDKRIQYGPLFNLDGRTVLSIGNDGRTIYTWGFENENLVDSRDGKSYKTVTINGRRWMAENLRYEIDDPIWSVCYRHESGYVYNCVAKGQGAMSVGITNDFDKRLCPKGWRLPTYSDWESVPDEILLGMHYSVTQKHLNPPGGYSKGSGSYFIRGNTSNNGRSLPFFKIYTYEGKISKSESTTVSEYSCAPCRCIEDL